ncbi:MAG: hypothetical protein ACD_34C00309G0002 [uncultured bacterium]|nr:MAG: hypothetical protein ACD_34C00309G0002 [uncultured bacterium]
MFRIQGVGHLTTAELYHNNIDLLVCLFRGKPWHHQTSNFDDDALAFDAFVGDLNRLEKYRSTCHQQRTDKTDSESHQQCFALAVPDGGGIRLSHGA